MQSQQPCQTFLNLTLNGSIQEYCAFISRMSTRTIPADGALSIRSTKIRVDENGGGTGSSTITIGILGNAKEVKIQLLQRVQAETGHTGNSPTALHSLDTMKTLRQGNGRKTTRLTVVYTTIKKFLHRSQSKTQLRLALGLLRDIRGLAYLETRHYLMAAIMLILCGSEVQDPYRSLMN